MSFNGHGKDVPGRQQQRGACSFDPGDQESTTNHEVQDCGESCWSLSHCPASHKDKRKENTARARRSRLRLEEFQRRKEEEKQEKQQETGIETVGDSSRNSCKLVVQLSKEENKAVDVETGPHSPILQVDGQDAVLCKDVSYTFKSEYGEEDIRSSLEEMFPPFVAQLDSRVRLGRNTADHQCIVILRNPFGRKERLSWPEMPIDDDVFREIKKIG